MAAKTLVIYVSVSHGNTVAVARAIADGLGAEMREPEEVDPATVADYDVVGVGSGIFAMSHHPRLRRFVARLPRSKGTRAFVFGTAGTGALQHRPWESSLESMLAAKGYDVSGSFACRGYDTWLPLRLVGGINKGHPDVDDLARAHHFGEQLRRKVSRSSRARPPAGARRPQHAQHAGRRVARS